MPEISELGFNAHGDVVQLRPAGCLTIALTLRRQIDQVESKSVSGAGRIYKIGGSSNPEAQILKKVHAGKENGCRMPAFWAHQALHEIYIGCRGQASQMNG